ncbi:type IV toxin-antitoxin system AbiEi family antitoxin domain-containing protein [Leucobacter sp. HY1910]
MAEVLTYLERLREIALDQHGFVTAAQAVEDGIPKTELPKLAARGRVERILHGVYRVPQVTATPHDNLALAVLWTGAPEACLSHETALAAWSVSDVNPERIHLTVTRNRRIRRSGGERYVIHRRDLASKQRTWWEGIPITDLQTTIEDCIRTGTATYLIRQAIERGGRTSLLSATAGRQLESLLDARDYEAVKA